MFELRPALIGGRHSISYPADDNISDPDLSTSLASYNSRFAAFQRPTPFATFSSIQTKPSSEQLVDSFQSLSAARQSSPYFSPQQDREWDGAPR